MAPRKPKDTLSHKSILDHLPRPGSLDDGADLDEMEDRDVLAEGSNPLQDAWDQVGASLFQNPRSLNERTELPDNLSMTPIIAAGSIEGAARLMVEVRNPDTGQADYLGEVPLNITPGQIIKRYWKSCPQKPGEPAAEFYFKALDKTGTKIGTANKPDGHISVPFANPLLQAILQEEQDKTRQAQASDGGLAFKLLQEQLERERQERIETARKAEEAAKHAREMEQALLKQRLDHAGAMQADLAVAYQQVNKTQETGFQSLMTTSERAALEREKREEERRAREQSEEERRRQRERDQYEEERKRREEERREERERLRAENQAALERVKAENEARLREIEARVRLEEAKIRADAEAAKAEKLAEIERMKIDREREDARRKDEQDRRDRLDAAERERAREFSLAMEKIRTDALASAEKRLEAEGQRQAEHTRLVIDMLKERNNPSGHKLGVVGDLLEMTGLSVTDLIEKGKDLLGGAAGASPAIAIIEGISGAVQEFIKRMPTPDEGDVEEDDEVEEEEETAPPPPKRRIAKRQPPQIEKQETLPVLREAASPDALPASIQAQLEPEPAANAATAIPLAERREGRAAVEALVQRLDGVEEDRWATVIMEGTDVDALVRYVGAVGLRSALDGYEVNAERLGAILVELGLFERVPMDPAKE